MKPSTLIAALCLSVGFVLGAQAHLAGHQLDETQCKAAWEMASPNGEAILDNQAELYVVNSIYVDNDADGQITLDEFKSACTSGLMTDAAITMSQECTDTHIAQMDDMIAMMTDAPKREDAIAQLEMSRVALKKGDTAECAKHMIEAHRDMGM